MISPDIVHFKPKSRFTSPKHRNQSVETFCCLVEEASEKTTRVQKLNLSPGEKAALKSLQSDSTITIKHSDKGGAKIIIDTEK